MRIVGAILLIVVLGAVFLLTQTETSPKQPTSQPRSNSSSDEDAAFRNMK